MLGRFARRFRAAPAPDKNGDFVDLPPETNSHSERKRVEDALRESEDKFHTLFDSANDCIIILDLEGYIRDINRTGYERLGFTKEEMLGRHISHFDPPEFSSGVTGRIARLWIEGRQY